MTQHELQGCLAFIQQAEKLKNTLRSSHTSTGRSESTAEHTWRLCLMAMVFEAEFKGIDFAKLLKLCLVHDLGEAIGGDIPAVAGAAAGGKTARERDDLLALLEPLDQERRAAFAALWEEYAGASSAEARFVKALDKLETIVQHNQGRNPESFDYAFNLAYGREYMSAHPLFMALRGLVDTDTRRRAGAANPTGPSGGEGG